MMHKRAYPIRSFLLTTAITVLLAGCEIPYGGDENPPVYQTEILEVRVEPNPVAMGATTTFTVIIRDSLDASFKFSWFIPGPFVVTEENSLQWVADVQPGQYNASVLVSKDNPDESGALAPVAEFRIDVISNQ